MKNFIKENWFKISIIFLVIIITSGLFYWYEWRPSEIRKNCQIKANEIKYLFKSSSDARDTKENRYKECLRENGL